MASYLDKTSKNYIRIEKHQRTSFITRGSDADGFYWFAYHFIEVGPGGGRVTTSGTEMIRNSPEMSVLAEVLSNACLNFINELFSTELHQFEVSILESELK